ncbi:MurR/RpiR family transcriptional regulator [Pacificoceanicola onchidii]|uniref:MurR/RpiR family transcriptional regulator n=1 Tax=Pacificoceanicola onchidii TaxID=2562685 RepID=UPI001455E482|nr:MurR/RpiR family transcriptional regulator [Pacificoceanicola onchidii]
MSILQNLRSALPDLPKKLALAARYALDHPDQMALHSMRATATEVGVTSTTMLRLARHLGYDSFDDFRAAFQSELVSGVFASRAGALHDEGQSDQDALGDRIISAARGNIGDLHTTLRQDDLDAIAVLMRQASNVYLVGSGSLFWLATLMRTTGDMVLPNLRLVGTEFQVAAEAMSALKPGDVVIGFALNPTAKRTADAMQFARKNGAHLVAITDRPSSPIAEGAEHVLCANTASPHYYPSVAPLMVIVEALLATVVASGDGQELRSIRKWETIRSSNQHYIEY